MQCSAEQEPIPARTQKGIDYYDHTRPPKTWKYWRKTKYRRIAGLSAKQVEKYLNFCIKFNLESRFKRAGL